MKKLGPLIAIALVALAGWYAWSAGLLGGNVDVNAPTDTPDVSLPDADEVGDAAGDAARGAEDGAKTAADTLAGLDPVVWRMVGLGIGVACIVWVIKNPKRLAITLGVGIVALLLFITGGGMPG